MTLVRSTPDNAFAGLVDYPFRANYHPVDTLGDEVLRMHYVDEGPESAPVVLLLHGEPSWSYLYRKMIPPLVAAGYRVIAPDLIGFGRSDKLPDRESYTYARHLRWLGELIRALGLQSINLFCQDWGGLLGLRIVAAEPDRFATICASNTFLPTGDFPMPEAFLRWREFSQSVPVFPVSQIIDKATVRPMSDSALAAYDAPYPDEALKAGARQFPLLVPVDPNEPESIANRKAWGTLLTWEKPFLTLFADQDPVTQGAERIFQAKVPGAAGQPHAIIENSGHFIQEDAGEELAQHLINWIPQA